ncbi:tRNA pseudouridine(38-40) synthase TruA [Salinarchaeum sp. IM2453]|uniref:tRNA pseudouridine(38-40) synthase TruA n=1 Tax=Salinarchaeum sp. IM2453 TaxID=2862870 RepID=UPI001C832278|nr:tRNA pseudouridine(38-40) synthase TruA [Salinarchaeum sp. IM2453]QZA89260.1 tRNA pseudouridine(38-40) synthase TruA [Salinarchaeum sp. IM2453]
MPKHAFRVAYDGQGYHGFQRQPDVDTISDTFLDALAALDIHDENIPPGYAASGRTDAGVSAVAQTIAFDAPKWLTPEAINTYLPDDIIVWAYTTVPEEFHPTHDAVRRRYEYLLYPDGHLDTSRLESAITRLSGYHDFHNLTLDSTGTHRDLTIEFQLDDPYIVLQFESDGFPRQFVRRAVSLLRMIATGARDLAFIDRVLSDQPLPGPDGIAPASPLPLLLVDVVYSNRSFQPSNAVENHVSTFTKFHKQHLLRAGVVSRISDRIQDLSVESA